MVREFYARGLVSIRERQVSLTSAGQEVLGKTNISDEVLNFKLTTTSDPAERIRIYQSATMSA
jgi:hypothetical protein